MYAQIVVLTYQSPGIDSYTYEIPQVLQSRIKIGQLVTVPFGNRNPLGVVISCHPERSEGSQTPNKEILRYAQNDKRENQNDKQVDIKPITSIILDLPLLLPYQIELLKWMNFYYRAPMAKCLDAMLPKLPGLSIYHNPGLGKLSSATVGQTLVLVPSINQIPQTLALFPHAKNYVVYHGEQKPWERFDTWQKILSGNIDLVVGTRSAIFTPCPKLGKIVIYNEHEEGYKSERSPYYNTQTIAEKIQELTKCELEIVDDAPRITTYFVHTVHDTRPGLNYDTTMSSPGLEPKVQIVNMADEKAAGNKGPLSDILQTYIKAGVAKDKKILLFLNKKTESGHVYCKSCKHSDFAKKKPAACPNCQSQDILFYTNNVKSLTNLVTKLTGVTSVTVATAAVFYQLMKQKYDLVAHVSTDTLLNIADYTSAEKLYTQIINLKKITRGLLLLQTYNPEDPTIKAAAAGNYEAFYQSQLSMRKMLKYPPFVLLVKLALKGKKEEKIEQKAQRLYKTLNDLRFTINDSRFTILGPFKPTSGTTNAKYNIILKVEITDYSIKTREKAVKSVEPLLSKVPSEWKIEVEATDIN